MPYYGVWLGSEKIQSLYFFERIFTLYLLLIKKHTFPRLPLLIVELIKIYSYRNVSKLNQKIHGQLTLRTII